MSLLAVHPGWVSRVLAWLSPFAYTLFLTHVFTFTFFTRAYLRFFPMPEFFSIGGWIYILTMLLTAVAVSIVLKMVWSRLIATVRALA